MLHEITQVLDKVDPMATVKREGSITVDLFLISKLLQV